MQGLSSKAFGEKASKENQLLQERGLIFSITQSLLSIHIKLYSNTKKKNNPNIQMLFIEDMNPDLHRQQETKSPVESRELMCTTLLE